VLEGEGIHPQQTEEVSVEEDSGGSAEEDARAGSGGEAGAEEATPHTSTATMSITPSMETKTLAPDVQWSNQTTQRPDYWKLNDSDWALVTNEPVVAPNNYTEAINQPDAQIWEKTMEVKIRQHQDIGTWELVQLLPGRNAIGCRWVFAVKTEPDGKFEKGKA
jgi:hypothetical protein